MSFDSFDLDAALLDGVRDLGFTEPTDIQQDAIPWALEGRDLLACAITGSGKTAAFVLPILQRLLHRDRGKIRALVLSPTRELALQTEDHFKKLGTHTGIRVASVFGGVGYDPQERAFRQGYDVIVATPGRLLDLLGRPWASLDDLEVLVLDEADRMLDMGFIPDVRRILKHVPGERQTMLFSATLAQPIVKLSADILTDPVTINLESRSAPPEGVRQTVYPVRHELKPALLLHLLQRHDVESALVFTRTKVRADLVGEYLRRAGISVAVIHGDRSQKHRTRVMEDFKGSKYQVLVATDVAARGIDVEDLSMVVNLDVPDMPDDYIHRVGRTARAGSTGDALTFVAARELAALHLIEKSIGQKLERIRLDDFDYSPSAAAATPPPAAPAEEPEEVEEEAVGEEAEEEPVAEETHEPPEEVPDEEGGDEEEEWDEDEEDEDEEDEEDWDDEEGEEDWDDGDEDEDGDEEEDGEEWDEEDEDEDGEEWDDEDEDEEEDREEGDEEDEDEEEWDEEESEGEGEPEPPPSDDLTTILERFVALRARRDDRLDPEERDEAIEPVEPEEYRPAGPEVSSQKPAETRKPSEEERKPPKKERKSPEETRTPPERRAEERPEPEQRRGADEDREDERDDDLTAILDRFAALRQRRHEEGR